MQKVCIHNVAYVNPNMERIFECNNLRFSSEMFCHISVIKDDCCVVAYGGFLFAWTYSVWVAGQTESWCRKSNSILVWTCSFADIFHISFSPLTNVSILKLNSTELMAADDYLNWILPKCALVSVR